MLKHMIETQVLNLILGGVDLLVRVFEVGLDDKRRRISSFRCRSMIAASVATLGEDVGNVAVLQLSEGTQSRSTNLGDDLLDELSQSSIHEIRNDTNAFRFARIEGVLHVASHAAHDQQGHARLRRPHSCCNMALMSFPAFS